MMAKEVVRRPIAVLDSSSSYLPEKQSIGPEEAAEVLMGYLPKDTVERIREARESFQIPIWHLLLGYVMKCRDREEIWSPLILSMWENGLPASSPRPCKSCGHMFVGPVPEAAYCCTPCFFGKLPEFGHSENCHIGKK